MIGFFLNFEILAKCALLQSTTRNEYKRNLCSGSHFLPKSALLHIYTRACNRGQLCSKALFMPKSVLLHTATNAHYIKELCSKAFFLPKSALLHTITKARYNGKLCSNVLLGLKKSKVKASVSAVIFLSGQFKPCQMCATSHSNRSVEQRKVM